jgi:predicted nucleic acid-binding protein
LPSSTDLLDANVWLALAAEAHAHHAPAKAYWEKEGAPEIAFCRLTQLAFLRHLTNKTIMGDQMLSPANAWKKLQEFQALP